MLIVLSGHPGVGTTIAREVARAVSLGYSITGEATRSTPSHR
jgi:cytidylate kinase